MGSSEVPLVICSVIPAQTNKSDKMQMLKFLLPLLLVASCSAFSLGSLFSSAETNEELPAVDSEEEFADEIDEDIEEEEDDEEDDEEEEEELDEEAEEDEEEELEEEEELDTAALEAEDEQEEIDSAALEAEDDDDDYYYDEYDDYDY